MTHAEPPIVAAIRRHHAGIGAALRGAGVCASDVDDLTQEVLAIFCRRFGDIAEAAHSAFLRETARRVAADYRRLKWNRALVTHLDFDLADAEQRAPEALLEQRQTRELVSDAICALNAADRRIFLLSHFERWSRTQIAEHLALPSGTVASRLRRANDQFSTAVARLVEHREPNFSAFDAPPPWSAPARTRETWAVLKGDAPLVGTHRYIDNQWGRARASAGYDQCLLRRARAGFTELGWSWNWPGYHPDGFALPELLVGWKPWLGGRPTDPRFPLPLERIQRVWVDFDVEQTAQGTHELVLNLWLLKATPAHGYPNPDLISAEIMIALDHTEASDSKPAALVMLAGQRYELREHSQAQGSRVEPWPLLSLRRCEPATQASFDIAELLRTLASRGALQNSRVLGSIEFGNRVFGGEGTAWVRRFDLDVVQR